MTDPSPNTQENERIDRFGAIASSLCAIHCAICALLPAAFGALGLGMLLSQEVEWLFTIFAVSFALLALILVVRQKRSHAIAGLLILGIIGLLASRGLEMGSEHHHHGDEHHADHKEHHEEEHHAEHKEEHRNERTEDAHEDKHHAEHKEEHRNERTEDAHEDKHHAEHEEAEHSDSMHSIGASMGVLGGLLLLFGHILNIRSMRSSLKKDDSYD